MKSLESIYNSILLENLNIDIELLKKCVKGTYTINDDGSIDVKGGVYLYDMQLIKIPFKFRNVSGHFDCGNNQLTSLDGAPNSVGSYFSCANNQLTSLDGAPNSVGSYFDCSYNQLTSLKGAPNSVSGHFDCGNNQLTSLKGAPNSVSGDFYCSYNQLTSLKGAPNSVSGDFYCSYNQLISLKGAPNSVSGDFYYHKNPNIPYSELFKIVDNVEGDIYYSSVGIAEDKDKIRRDRDVKGILKSDELGDLDV